jgi:hypothetical protein
MLPLRSWKRSAVIAGAAAAVVSITLVVVGPLAWQVGGHTVSSLHGKARADAIDAVRQTLLAAARDLPPSVPCSSPPARST